MLQDGNHFQGWYSTAILFCEKLEVGVCACLLCFWGLTGALELPELCAKDLHC